MVELGKLFHILPLTVVISALSTPYFPVGSSLQHGKYPLRRVLSCDRGAVTYQATHSQLRCPIILKTVGSMPQGAQVQRAVAQQLSEQAPVIAKLSHPHLAHINDLFIESGLPCLVFDFHQGKDAARWIKRHPLPIDEALHYIQQLGDALIYLHQQGYVHGAISPEHVMVDRDRSWATLIGAGLDCPRVLDNRSRSHSHRQREGAEPLRPIAIPATDVYGLAATLHTLVTGQSPVGLLKQVQWARTEDSPSLAALLQSESRLPAALAMALASGLTLSARQRPSTVADWLTQLPGATLNQTWLSAASDGLHSQADAQERPGEMAALSDAVAQSDSAFLPSSTPTASVTPFPNAYRRPRPMRFPIRALMICALLATATGLGLGLMARLHFAQQLAEVARPLNGSQPELPLKQESFAPRRSSPSGTYRLPDTLEDDRWSETPSSWNEERQQWASPSSSPSSDPYSEEFRDGTDFDAARDATPAPADRPGFDSEWRQRQWDEPAVNLESYGTEYGTEVDPWDDYQPETYDWEPQPGWDDPL